MRLVSKPSLIKKRLTAVYGFTFCTMSNSLLRLHMVWPDQLLAEGEDIQVNNLEYFYSVNFSVTTNWYLKSG